MSKSAEYRQTALKGGALVLRVKGRHSYNTELRVAVGEYVEHRPKISRIHAQYKVPVGAL